MASKGRAGRRYLTRLPLTLLLVLTAAFPAKAATPLVDAAWVASNTAAAGVVMLDVRSRGAYLNGHVPGAVNTNYGRDGWRVKSGKLPGMLPKMANLEKLFGRLGIGNDSHVVILPGGYSAGEMGVATRIYWTFKVAGHRAVSILNGGMAAYMADKRNPLSRQPARPKPAVYKAAYQAQYVASAEQVSAALQSGGNLIDSRPRDQFLGVNKSGQVKRHGTLPGAKSLPGKWTTVDDGGWFRNAATLRQLYEAVGAAAKGPAITFCNTGHWASLGWFVHREILGNEDVRLYDGSMAAWTRTPENQVERKIPLK